MGGDVVKHGFKRACALAAASCVLVTAGASAQQPTTTSTYTYDPLGRLVMSTDTPTNTANPATQITYAFDPAGNRTSVSTIQGLIPSPSSATVPYGPAQNLIPLKITGGTPTSVAVVTKANNGTATANGTNIYYSPNAGFWGVNGDSFQYTATNALGTSPAATVTITVNPPAPVAGALSTSVVENSLSNTIQLPLSGGPAASITVTTTPSNGTASPSGTNVVYQPNGGYVGSDSFWYTATNAGGTSAAAKVSITVTQQPPTALPVGATVWENSTGNSITPSVTGPYSSVAVTKPGNGTATANGTSISYAPNGGFSGTDTFQYTATNVGGTSSPATVTVTVNSTLPVANPLIYSSTASTYTANVVASDSSPLGYSLTITNVTQPSNASVSIVNNNTGIQITQTTGAPPLTEKFNYTISDGHGGTATSTITFTWKCSGTCS